MPSSAVLCWFRDLCQAGSNQQCLIIAVRSTAASRDHANARIAAWGLVNGDAAATFLPTNEIGVPAASALGRAAPERTASDRPRCRHFAASGGSGRRCGPVRRCRRVRWSSARASVPVGPVRAAETQAPQAQARPQGFCQERSPRQRFRQGGRCLRAGRDAGYSASARRRRVSDLRATVAGRGGGKRCKIAAP